MKIIVANSFKKISKYISSHQLDNDFNKMTNLIEHTDNLSDLIKNNKVYKINFKEYYNSDPENNVFVYRLNMKYRVLFSVIENNEVLILDVVKH